MGCNIYLKQYFIYRLKKTIYILYVKYNNNKINFLYIDRKKNMNKVNNLDSILNLGNDVLKSNTQNGSTLYNANLFTDMNNKEKKSLRIKLRRKKDNFISTFVQNKDNKDVLNELKDVWTIYAKQIYVDVNKIIDNNSTTQNKQDALNFLSFINSVEKTETKKDNRKK